MVKRVNRFKEFRKALLNGDYQTAEELITCLKDEPDGPIRMQKICTTVHQTLQGPVDGPYDGQAIAAAGEIAYWAEEHITPLVPAKKHPSFFAAAAIFQT